jgi:glutamine synthetase
MAHTLPRTLYDALSRFHACKRMRTILGDRFMRAVMTVRRGELEAYQRVISSWEREHLLLNV